LVDLRACKQRPSAPRADREKNENGTVGDLDSRLVHGVMAHRKLN
jgi:hypothetical protein